MNRVASPYNHKLVLLSLTLITWTIFSYTLIDGLIPAYIPLLCILSLFTFHDISQFNCFDPHEFKFYLYQLLFAGLLCIQAILIANPKVVMSLLSILSGMAIMLATKKSITDQRQLLIIANLFIILHIIGGVLAIIQAFTGSLFPDGFLQPEESGLWLDPIGFEGMVFSFGKNYLFLVLFSFMAIRLKLYLKTATFPKVYLYFIFSFSSFIVILGGRRSTQLALLTVLIGYYLWQIRKRLVLSATWLILLIATSAFALWFFIDKARDAAGYTAYTRIVLWHSGLLMLIDHPFIGVGMGMFKDVYSQYQTVLDFIPDYDSRVMDPHNWLLGIVTGTGLIGLSLITLSYSQLYLYLKRFNADDMVLIIINKSVGLYLIAFLIDFQFHNYWNDNNIWFFLGMAFAMRDIKKKTSVKFC